VRIKGQCHDITDRELLKMAAKAAGYALTKGSSGYREFLCKGGVEWNPLADDGDALRLAMTLGIDIVWCSSGRIITIASVGDRAFEAVESSREDSEENTRRAITRAAAEIGRAME